MKKITIIGGGIAGEAKIEEQTASEGDFLRVERGGLGQRLQFGGPGV